ncbi:MBL fold metallo-hydrolase [Winogradskyella ursingii]|uniref:MBL fold metallo-hydrolase n=1 Tax=Winogradskyella ursingii TaxID=2686079 RepID=UPI0015C8FBD0|nr:MBL fold metallo-hydrolase [Winogradskyella ursingii]
MKLFQLLYLLFIVVFFGCNSSKKENEIEDQANRNKSSEQYLTILGVAQDVGYPQIDCEKECCKLVYNGVDDKEMVSSLGLVDLKSNKKWLFDATPDIAQQLHNLKKNHLDNGNVIDGIFLTHAHIGHYTGLMFLGREALGGKQIPVYAMSRMKSFLETNGPWEQLVELENIKLNALKNDSTIILNKNLKVKPFKVPHRDEYSETVGYKIEGKKKSALYIPDIDKWNKWERNIIDEVKKVDYAFLDATFFKEGELSRPMSEVPHPFIQETINLFEKESAETKSKIYFIHLNHTNPALLDNSKLKDSIQNLGYHFAKQGANFEL